MQELTMLDVAAVDLEMLVMALEDHSLEGSWWVDPATGAVERYGFDDEADDIEERGLVVVEPGDSRDAYQDMVDFAHLVGDPKTTDLMLRALEGRGAFRRFKDTVYQRGELGHAWNRFSDLRMKRRAIKWLAGVGLISHDGADEALASLPDEPVSIGPPGPGRIAQLAANDIAGLYGDRLIQVVFYGSHARGEGGPESDIDLLVVLEAMDSAWDELRRMDDLLWRLSLRYGVTLSVLPVTQAQFADSGKPVLSEARSHGELLV